MSEVTSAQGDRDNLSILINEPREDAKVSPNTNSVAQISIIMPAYNEAKFIDRSIAHVVQALSELSETYELIIVDDGSSDETYGKVSSIAQNNPSLKLVRNSRNSGKGASVKRAAALVTGSSVIVIDSDMEIDPRSVRAYLAALKDHDICIASKRHPQSVYSAPLTRKFLSTAFNKVVRLMTGVPFSDTQTGLKAARGEHFRKIANVMSVKRYAYDVEFLAIAGLMNLRVAELPVRIQQDSTFSTRAVMYMIVDLLGISYRLRVKKWYQKSLNKENVSYSPILRI